VDGGGDMFPGDLHDGGLLLSIYCHIHCVDAAAAIRILKGGIDVVRSRGRVVVPTHLENQVQTTVTWPIYGAVAST
jgi:hypothetical protein